MTDSRLKSTPLHALHVSLGAKMVPFAGYDMPVNYPLGVLKEHLHARAHAGLFDVSHMGQATLTGKDIAAALETLVPGDIAGLKPGQIRYTLLLNDQGGIIDDLMVTRADRPDTLFLVVNAACKDGDFAHIAAKLAGKATLTRHDDKALLALQGPEAASVLAKFIPAAARMEFMTSREDSFDGVPVRLFRSGYTGEDGYEISVPNTAAENIAKALLAAPGVQPIGLGARDSLRLEAGLCLYGSDIDTATSPVEAALSWVIGKRRREQAGFPGAARIQKELKDGATRKRVGIKPLGRAPARAHTEIQDASGKKVGEITSGGFGPSFNAPVAMGYVDTALAKPGTKLNLIVRGAALPAEVVTLPFVPHRYVKSKA
ncbi:MAG: glycine cleavage system aminomethyltransferase GcvT [Rhodospirillaceae bacterium]|nr:glycine cleavage system aminomethyltransferase GcvT [Rhodospirillaceae bacterium]